MSKEDSVLDLQTLATKTTDRDVYKTLVAVFKLGPEAPRVLADSENYLAYTLKNRRTLRLVARSNNMKGTLKAHQQQIHAVKFVNFRSNVAASASDKEFHVWVVTDDNPPGADSSKETLTVRLYFSLVDPVTVFNFSFFINATVGIPDMVILYNSKAAVLESSKLIGRYDKEPLEAKLSSDSRELRDLVKPVTVNTLCCINNAGWFAFSTEDTLVAACTLRNRSTPAWPGCQGAAVKGLELLDPVKEEDPALLFASSKAKIFQWKLSGQSEPELLRTFTFGNTITTMLSSRSTLAIFNDAKEVALLELKEKEDFQAVSYVIDTEVRASSVCFNRTPNCGCVLVDAGTQVELYQLTVAKAAAAAAAATTGASKPMSPVSDPAILDWMTVQPSSRAAAGSPNSSNASPSAARPTSSAINNLVQQIERGNLRANSAAAAAATTPITVVPAKAAATAVAAEKPSTVSPASIAVANAARAALLNAALPQNGDGILAAATYESDDVVRRELESLSVMAKNISQIVELTPDHIARDHEQLVNLALEAQMTELQNAGITLSSSGSSKAASGGVDKQTDDAFSSYVFAKLLVPIANDIASGVSRGIHTTLRTELDNALRNVLGDSVRESQRTAIRRRLEEALQESTSVYSAEVRQRMQDFVNRDLREIFAQVNASLSTLVEENRRLQSCIAEITGSGILAEMESMRSELQRLRDAARDGTLGSDRDRAQGANPSSFQHTRATPETILTMAEGLIREGEVGKALEFLVSAKQPLIMGKLIKVLSEDAYSSLVSSKTISEDLWARFFSQLFEERTVSLESGDIEWEAELTMDVLSERDMLSKNTAKVQQLSSDIRHFIAKAKKKGGISPMMLRTLKNLEKSIQ